MHKRIKLLLFIGLLVGFIAGCTKPKPTPRPVAYYRFYFPKKTYKLFAPDSCPFSFQMPKYAVIRPFKGDSLKHKCWFNIVFPMFKAQINVTYYPIHGNLEELIDDSYTLAYKHSIKADDIIEKNYVDSVHRVYATIFYITGNAASALQFHITDSTKHFFRGSLYFDTRPNRDSLDPAIKFLTKDILRLIHTFRWKD